MSVGRAPTRQAAMLATHLPLTIPTQPFDGAPCKAAVHLCVGIQWLAESCCRSRLSGSCASARQACLIDNAENGCTVTHPGPSQRSRAKSLDLLVASFPFHRPIGTTHCNDHTVKKALVGLHESECVSWTHRMIRPPGIASIARFHKPQRYLTGTTSSALAG